MRFEQRELPIKDKVTPINLGDEANPKPIFKSKSLSSFEKEDLIQLIREYINVFAWNYEDMPGLDPRLLCIVLTSTRTLNQSNNSNNGSVPGSWKQSNQR